MSEPMSILALVCVIGCAFGAFVGIIVAIERKTGVAKREKQLEEAADRLAKLERKFSSREARFVIVKPFSDDDDEYKRSLKNISDSESFRWFMFQLRERAIESMKTTDAGNSARLIGLTAQLTALDEIQAAMAIVSQKLIAVEEEDDGEI